MYSSKALFYTQYLLPALSVPRNLFWPILLLNVHEKTSLVPRERQPQPLMSRDQKTFPPIGFFFYNMSLQLFPSSPYRRFHYGFDYNLVGFSMCKSIHTFLNVRARKLMFLTAHSTKTIKMMHTRAGSASEEISVFFETVF